MGVNLTRREKFMKNGSRTPTFTNKVEINFNIQTLDIMTSYVLSENRTIKTAQLINMRNLFDCIDMEIYKTDEEKKKKIAFIKKALDARVIKNLKSQILILQYINGGLLDVNYLGVDLTALRDLSNDEIQFVNETISSALKYVFIYNDVDSLYDILTRFKSADYISKQYIVSEIESVIAVMQNKFRRVKVDTSNEIEFRLEDKVMEESFRDIYEKITNPSARLVTGLQGLNEMLGGGFYGTRTYMLLGLTGGGKSLTLLDLCLQIKKYNKEYKTKDPTKRPCLVYLTMENTVEETIERIFDMCVGRDISEFSYDEALKLLRTEGELSLTDESPIDIIIKYKPNKSIDTSYLYTLAEDLEDEGYEMIGLVQDHIGRIKSTENNTETRIELGTVANEFKTFAQLKDIPVITNFHLNRDAASRVDEGFRASKSDLVRLLGRDNVAESQFMINNIDGCFMITQEFDRNGNKWLGVMRTKKRYKASERSVIFMPYKNPNSPKLIEDYYSTVPVFKDTLRENAQIGTNNQPSKNKIPPIPQFKGNTESIDSIIGTQNNIVKGEVNIFELETMSDLQCDVVCGYREDLDKEKELPKKNLKVYMTRNRESAMN